MRVFLFVCVFVVIFATSFAAQAIIPADKTPGHPGHCNSDTTGPMEKGEVRSLEGKCTRATCASSGDIILHTCGAVASPCKGEINYSKPYPECCESLLKAC